MFTPEDFETTRQVWLRALHNRQHAKLRTNTLAEIAQGWGLDERRASRIIRGENLHGAAPAGVGAVAARILKELDEEAP